MWMLRLYNKIRASQVTWQSQLSFVGFFIAVYFMYYFGKFRDFDGNFITISIFVLIPLALLFVFSSVSAEFEGESVLKDYYRDLFKVDMFRLSMFSLLIAVLAAVFVYAQKRVELIADEQLKLSLDIVLVIFVIAFSSALSGFLIYMMIVKFRISRGYFGLNIEEAMDISEYMIKKYGDHDASPPPSRLLHSDLKLTKVNIEKIPAAGEII